MAHWLQYLALLLLLARLASPLTAPMKTTSCRPLRYVSQRLWYRSEDSSQDELDVERWPTSESFREHAFLVSSSFEPRKFCPPPLLSNKHLQTIAGVFLRNDASCRYVKDSTSVLGKGIDLLFSLIEDAPDRHGQFWDQRQCINTPDGDFFHVDYKYHSDIGDPTSKGLVILIHGLQSNSNSSLSVDLAKAYGSKGFDVACINFRGCSGVPNNGLRAYHMGFTDDLKYYLSVLTDNGARQTSPIFLSGFSLGANVVLKALGELGDAASEKYNIYGAAVCGVPFDNERNVHFFQAPGFNKIVYNGSILKSLKQFAIGQFERYPHSEGVEKVDWARVVACDEITDFDDAFIAPLFGYENNIDYYRKTSCSNYLDDIRVPTFVMNAGDDPFFDPEVFPWRYSCDTVSGKEKQSPIKLVRTDHGGHLGFMFQRINHESEREEVSFMPSELARFVLHVFKRRKYLDLKQ